MKALRQSQKTPYTPAFVGGVVFFSLRSSLSCLVWDQGQSLGTAPADGSDQTSETLW